MNFFSEHFDKSKKNPRIPLLYNKIYAVRQQNLKLLRGLHQKWIFSEKAKIQFEVTHEKFQKPETIQNCIPKVFYRNELKNRWKKFHPIKYGAWVV